MDIINFTGLMLVLATFTTPASIQKLKQEKSGETDRPTSSWEVEPVDCGSPWFYNAQKRIYTTACKTANVKPCTLITENWLINEGVDTVYINIGGGGNNCTGCSPQYELQVFLTNDSGTLHKLSQMIPTSRTKKRSTFYDYNETIKISLVGYKSIKLKFKNSLFCGNINTVNIYYYNCPTTSKELITFPLHPASGFNITKIEGTCTSKSIPDRTIGLDRPYMICGSVGNSSVYGRCVCIPGSQPINHSCQECTNDEYKSTFGNRKCEKCGDNSSSKKYNGVECRCKDKYYRKKGQGTNYTKNCYQPPGAPSNIKFYATSNQVNISWDDSVPGSAKLGNYYIECTNCPKQEKAFPVITAKPSVSINRLKAVAQYVLRIYNGNNISSLIDEVNWNVVRFNFTTKPGGKPGEVRDLTHVVNTDYSITLKWKEPFNKGGEDLQYVLTYGKQSATTRGTRFVIKTGTEDKIYTVKVYAQAIVNGVLVTGNSVTYSEKITVKGGIPLTLTVAVSVSVIILVILVLLGSFCIWKKRHPSYLQVVRMENGTVQLPNKFFSHGKLYVDPTTYNAVDEAVQEFAREIERKDLTVGELLGGGEFAEVFKGSLYRNGIHREVAIKTLKSGGVTKRDRDDFFGEAAILGQFSDCPNVVQLEGVILKDRPNLIILEYMKNGALHSYLQKNDNQFDVTQLLGMARCVANGMTYLSEIGFIHRDLAARNILVDEFNVCKVSDFGMSREIKLDDTYDTQGGKIPVRWTAPEAIQYKKFTSASDIWSYGILLWEIMSFGERPYWDWSNMVVLERVNAGYRLPPPMNCPKVIHDLMLKCWHKDRTKRPKFKEIGDQIEQWIRTPLLLKGVADSVVRKRDENLDYTVLETINKWLEAIGMDRYTETFLNHGYSTPRQVLNLSMDDLQKLEIGPIGHKKKIYKAIQNTKEQVDARHNSVDGKTVKKYSLPTFKK